MKTGDGRENQSTYVKMCANGREKTMKMYVKKRENRENPGMDVKTAVCT